MVGNRMVVGFAITDSIFSGDITLVGIEYTSSQVDQNSLF
jgi:hypothetical protein